MTTTNEETIRQALIRYLTKIDPVGCFTDEDSRDNGIPPLTLEDAVSELVQSLLLYEHYMTINGLI